MTNNRWWSTNFSILSFTVFTVNRITTSTFQSSSSHFIRFFQSPQRDWSSNCIESARNNEPAPPPLCCPPYNTSYDTNVSCIQYKSTSSTDAEKWRSCCCALVVGVSQQYDKLLSLYVWECWKSLGKLNLVCCDEDNGSNMKTSLNKSERVCWSIKVVNQSTFTSKHILDETFPLFWIYWIFEVVRLLGLCVKAERERVSAQERCGHEKFLLKGGGERTSNETFFFRCRTKTQEEEEDGRKI